jgi:hypothetical protein
LPKTGAAADVEWVVFFPVTREIQRQSRRDDDLRCLLPRLNDRCRDELGRPEFLQDEGGTIAPL